MPSRRPRVLVLMLPLLLSSCCTMSLWGFEWQEDDSDEEDGGSWVQASGTQWEWWRVLLRIVATPVTIVADVPLEAGKSFLTFEWLSGDDEDDSGWDGGGSGWQSTSVARRSGSVPLASPSGPPAAVPRSITSGATTRRP